MNVQRDNIKAGLFVLVGLVLMLAVIFTLTDFGALLQKTQQVKVYYPLSIGLQGLRIGSSVTVGDDTIGKVVAIQGWPTDGRLLGHVITIETPQSEQYRFGWDARFELATQLIGNDAALNVRDIGSSAPYDPAGTAPLEALKRPFVPKGRSVKEMPWYQELFPQAPPDAVAKAITIVEVPADAIPGNVPINNLLRSFGVEEEQQAQIKNIIADAERITATLAADLPVMSEKAQKLLSDVDPIVKKADEAITNVRDATVDAKATVADLRERSKGWFDRVDTIGEKAEKTVDAGQQALERVNKIVEDKEPQIRQVVDDVAVVTKEVREKTLVQVTEALDKADRALANMESVSGELKTFMVGQRPVLERAVANLQITAAQLKLASIEVRRSPWRLIYQPGDKELEYDNLYDAARSFALAADALNSASQSLQAVSKSDVAEPQKINQMVDHLDELFGKFKDTEAKFWEALNAPKSTGK